jgi:hypothetical protein
MEANMADTVKSDDPGKLVAGRGPAYPYVSLGKAVARVEALRDQNMARIAASPMALYKVWGWTGDNGNARQTLAALNHFGLVEYVGRGDDRQIRLSELAHRIVLDKVPGSPDRAAAVREAALTPPIHKKLWEEYGRDLPPDVVIETFLVRDSKFNESAAKNLIGEYRETFEYAGLSQPDNMPPTEKPSASHGESSAMHAAQTETQTKQPLEVVRQAENEREWLRGPLSKEASYRLIVSGDLGPKEIGKLIKLLEAQQAVLLDDDEG